MRGAMLLAFALGGFSQQASAAELRDVSPHTVYLEVTGDIMSENAVGADGSSLYGTSCTVIGTGFIVSPGGHVITAGHLLTDLKCGGQGRRLNNLRIRAWRGVTPENGTPVEGHFVEGDEILSEDVALIDLNPSNPRYEPLRVCVDYLTEGEAIDTFGYLDGGPLIRSPGTYGHDAAHNAAGATRLLLIAPTGDGMSGGPVIASGGRAIAMIVSGERSDPLRSYASSMVGIAHLITRRTNRTVPDCERRPDQIERVGLQLDRSAFYLTQEQTAPSRNEADSQRLGGFLATYASNREYFAREFAANENRLIEILGTGRRGAVTSDNFYANPGRLFDLLGTGRQAAGENYVSAVLAYSENAWFLARFTTAEETIEQALTVRPRSLTLIDELLERRARLEDFNGVIDFVRSNPFLLEYRPEDVAEQRLLISVLRYYAWALWETENTNESRAIFERALGYVAQWPNVGTELRYHLLNDRVPLYVLYVENGIDEALAGALEAHRGLQRLLDAATADGRQADIRRLDEWLGRVENNLGWIYGEIGDLQRAREYATVALERKRRAMPVSPHSIATSLVNLGAFDVRLGNYEQGLQRLLTAEEHYDAFRAYGSYYQVRAARLHKDIALAYMRLGQRDQARLRLERGLRELAQVGERLKPDYLRTQVLLGYYFLEGNENFDALQAFRTARELHDAAASRDVDLDNLLDLFMGEALIRSGFQEPGLASVQIALDGMSEAGRSANYVLYFPRAELIERARGVLATNGARAH